MVKLDELFHNMVQSPNLISIAQHDEITYSYIAQHGEIQNFVLHNMVKSLNLSSNVQQIRQ